MSYDTKCHELADTFLSDVDGVTEKHVDTLAQRIQDAIEDFISEKTGAGGDSDLREKV